jgi:biopolymer transport protein ExbB
MVDIGIALERQLNRVLDGMPVRTLEVVHAH